MVKYDALTIDYNIDIDPRDDAESEFYDSYLVIDDGGCTGKPSFYKIEVPDCYERRKSIAAFLENKRGIGDVTIESKPPSPPKGGENYTCEYGLCTLKLKYETYDGLCSGSTNKDGR